MIRIMLGNVGSGKTASMVRELYFNDSDRITLSNIKTSKIKNNKLISSDMIIKRELDEKGKEKLSLNQEFWQETSEKLGCLNVVIDEAHAVLNPRRAMSKINVIMTDWVALLRRVLGSSNAGYGELVLITQLERRLDPIVKEMATSVYYHRCWYSKTCGKCGLNIQEHNEIPDPFFRCPRCQSSNIKKHNHIIEVWRFQSMELYSMWKDNGMKTYHKHYYINDIEKYFKNYNTLQWENLISQY